MGIGKIIRDGLPFSNVVNNGTATANVTPGRTLEKVSLKLGGADFTKAMITRLGMKANGKAVIDTTGPIIDALNAYRGRAQDAAFLDIHFADYGLNNEFDRMVSAFDTSIGIANLTFEVKIEGADAPTLVMKLVESGAQKDKSGASAPFALLLGKVLSYPFSIANGGRLPFQLPFGNQNGAIIKRVHVVHSGQMTGATVKLDGLTVMENVKAENEYQQKQHGRVPQANTYTLDFVADGAITKAFDTRDAKSLEWLFDFAGADNGTVIVEYLDALGNL